MRTSAVLMLWIITSACAFAAPPIPHVEARGSGDTTLILLHNTLADWTVWDSFMERNSERYTMLAPRLAGMGGSEPMEFPEGDPLDRTPWTDATVEALAQLCNERGIENAYAVGHGAGGVIAMRLAIDHPELVEGVALVDTMPAHPLTLHGIRFSDEERIQYLLQGLIPSTSDLDPIEWRAQRRDIAIRQTTDKAESEKLGKLSTLVDPAVWRRWTIETQAPDLTEELAASGARVAASATINDGLIRLFATRVMYEEFWNLAFDDVPGAEVTLFDGSKHYIFLEQPEEFDAMIARFIAGEEQPFYSARTAQTPQAEEEETE